MHLKWAYHFAYMVGSVLVVFEKALVTRDARIDVLIAKYNLEYTDGALSRKEFEIERETVLNVADDFINFEFIVHIVDKNEIAICR